MKISSFRYLRDLSLLIIPVLFTLSACSGQPQIPAAPSPNTPTIQDSPTPAPAATTIPTATPTTLPTHTPSATYTPTITAIPTETPTPTITVTPTSAVPVGNVQMRAFCRYGPGKAYLYSAELKQGDQVVIEGRNYANTWVWVKPANLNRNCWAAASVMQISGDLASVHVVTTSLPHSTFYTPPAEIQADRQGDTVTISWSPVWMTKDDDRGYLIEANVCENGARITAAFQTYDPSYVITDEQRCSEPSSGLLYTVDKHGYSDPVEIPWP